MSTSMNPPSVVVFGAGIHGVAIARELLLNGLGVLLVDAGDIASGATSKSSRLIHGGLRYLEYGDIELVKESLAERRRNLELAPQFVRPLRLYIPASESLTGLLPSAVGFLGGNRSALGRWFAGRRQSRGFWTVRMGLSMYDWLAGDDLLPPSSPVDLHDPSAPWVSTSRYRSLMSYSDAQMLYPERVVLALIADAESLAREKGVSFVLGTHTQFQRLDNHWEFTSPLWATPIRISPEFIVNAGGAAGDAVLAELGIAHEPLFGGTRGSHLLTWHSGLKAALHGCAVYAEASDGRPVFTLPFGDGVLIGTTDELHHGPVQDAVASDAEIAYLLGMVSDVFGIDLTRDDVSAHYSGVRPLPRSSADSNAAISRDHSLVWNQIEAVPVLTLVGGKLTTWRAFAEQATDHILGKLGRERISQTRLRRVPGNDPLPPAWEEDGLRERELAQLGKTTPEEVRSLWPLLGTRTKDVLLAVRDEPRREIADTYLSDRVVRWVIRHEHVSRLDDLVERRLMTSLQRDLGQAHLSDLAHCLVETGKLALDDVSGTVAATAARLTRYYGRRVS